MITACQFCPDNEVCDFTKKSKTCKRFKDWDDAWHHRSPSALKVEQETEK